MSTTPIVNVRHFACQACGQHLFNIEHLYEVFQQSSDINERAAGFWYCDACGVANRPTVYRDGSLRVEVKPEQRCLPTSVVLCIEPQDKPIYLLVKGMHWTDEKPDPGESVQAQQEQRDRYFYNEHTCPTNWFRHVQEIMIGDDCDPHGIAQHVGTILEPPTEDPNEDQLRTLVPRILGEQETRELQTLKADGWPEDLARDMAAGSTRKPTSKETIEQQEREIARLQREIEGLKQEVMEARRR